MKYFVDVTPFYSITTELGKKLNDIICDRYDGAIVSEEEANNMPEFITSQIAELCAKDKSLEPLVVRSSGFRDGKLIPDRMAMLRAEAEQIVNDDDLNAFSMYIYPVLKDYSEKKGLQKGE